MPYPLLRAEALIVNQDKSKVLFQCDLAESFYRLPGGKVELGEFATKTIERELLEEYDLPVIVEELACVSESQFGMRHDCTLIHWCTLKQNELKTIIHKEHSDVQLVWRTIAQLQDKPSYPVGIIDLLLSREKQVKHLTWQQDR